jgi:hypothetical protein
MAVHTEGGDQMELIAWLFVAQGAGMIGATISLTLLRHYALTQLRSEAPREPITLTTVAEWTLFSGPGLSLGASLVNFGCTLARAAF